MGTTIPVIPLPPSLCQFCDRLRSLVTQACTWEMTSAGSPWTLPTANEKGYYLFERGGVVAQFRQTITLPEHINDYEIRGLGLRLQLTWWADRAEVWVNGQLCREGDLFDSSTRLLLTPQASPNQQFQVEIKLISPRHDVGALMRSQLIYESASHDCDPGFVADEITILYRYLQQFQPSNLPQLEAVIQGFSWENLGNQTQFHQDLERLRHTLHPLGEVVRSRTVQALGHAHLDLAWLWPVAETWQVAENTFRSVLHLQDRFPQLQFGHSSPVLYEWIADHQPELFQEIQQKHKENRWHLLGGMWLEPDVYLLSGESLIRQVIYGQQFYEKHFGQRVRQAWLPDSFGFPAQLPQILHLGGMDYFVTGKLHWGDTHTFPHGLFHWESPDGSRVTAWMSPPNVAGVMDFEPMAIANYGLFWEQQTGLNQWGWLPGVGDHGGGPTAEMLAQGDRWQGSPFFPKITWGSPENFLDQWVQQIHHNGEVLPRWQDELYLEFHRGCYTSHSDQKTYQARAEVLLYEAEFWSSLAMLLDYQKLDKIEPTKIEINSSPLFDSFDLISFDQNETIEQQLDRAWRGVLFNQFHDILPGTSIPAVFEEANRTWEAAIALAQGIRHQAQQAISQFIQLPSPPHPEAIPLVVWNPLFHDRQEIFTYDRSGLIWNHRGESQPIQISHRGETLWLGKVPAGGYGVYWFLPQNFDREINAIDRPWCLQNDRVKIQLCGETGRILSYVYENKELLASPANSFEVFGDQGQYWDAWNIDPNYEEHPLPPPQLQSLTWLEMGPLRQTIRAIWRLNDSTIQQDYQLMFDSPQLTLQTWIDWQEDHTLLKVRFPLDLAFEKVATAIACGVKDRPRHPQTDREKAQWEWAALGWVDVNEGSRGVSLLTNLKYGHDLRSGDLRLTLLRSPRWPDPGCDRGEHRFTYALWPHDGPWHSTPRQSQNLRHPLAITAIAPIGSGTLPPAHSLLHGHGAAVQPLALYRQGDHLVFRCCEMLGQAPILNFGGEWGGLFAAKAVKTNLLGDLLPPGDRPIQPWQIVTYRLAIF